MYLLAPNPRELTQPALLRGRGWSYARKPQTAGKQRWRSACQVISAEDESEEVSEYYEEWEEAGSKLTFSASFSSMPATAAAGTGRKRKRRRNKSKYGYVQLGSNQFILYGLVPPYYFLFPKIESKVICPSSKLESNFFFYKTSWHSPRPWFNPADSHPKAQTWLMILLYIITRLTVPVQLLHYPCNTND